MWYIEGGTPKGWTSEIVRCISSYRRVGSILPLYHIATTTTVTTINTTTTTPPFSLWCLLPVKLSPQDPNLPYLLHDYFNYSIVSVYVLFSLRLQKHSYNSTITMIMILIVLLFVNKIITFAIKNSTMFNYVIILSNYLTYLPNLKSPPSDHILRTTFYGRFHIKLSKLSLLLLRIIIQGCKYPNTKAKQLPKMRPCRWDEWPMVGGGKKRK